MDNLDTDLELDISSGSTKAVIEGKTAVPFKQLVQLILQRKVTGLFNDWGKTAVVVDSALLTSLASAPQDNTENTTRVVLTGMACGVFAGVFLLSAIEYGLSWLNVTFLPTYHLILSGSLLGLAVLAVLLSRIQRKNRGEQIVDAVEKIANLMKR